MIKRIKQLREKSINTHPYISIERAKLITEAYKKNAGTVSSPVLRAWLLNI